MKKLEKNKFESVNGGGGCAKVGGFLAGMSLGTAGLTYFGIITIATGGTAGLALAVPGAGVAIYCASLEVNEKSLSPINRGSVTF